jgi:photosystem II stability/assembly factor-like uncharacterized protein
LLDFVGGIMLKNIKRFLLLLLPLLLMTSSIVGSDTSSCGRVFNDVPRPFSFRNKYFDVSGSMWEVGGYGSISIKSPNQDIKLFKLATKADFNSIFVVDSEFGFAVGTNGVIFVSKDAGNVWTTQREDAETELRAITCIDRLSCLAVGDRGTVLKTINGGADWNSQEIATDEDIFAVDFANDSTGWIAGRNGIVMKTTDRGNSWTINDTAFVFDDGRPRKEPVFWQTINFRDADKGCIAGYNIVMCTSDGGTTWNRASFNKRRDFLSLVFYNDKIRLLERCGNDFTSADFGKNWSAVKQKGL